MYKGYEVNEEIVHDYEYPETEFVIQAPCGCQACEDEVQPGHFACGTSPKVLQDSKHAFPRLENNRWFWVFTGNDDRVDNFLVATGSDKPRARI